MRSMTGYGRGTCEVAGRRLVVELRSVNHRFLEVKLRLPWNDAAVDSHVTQAIRGKLQRGVITVSARDEGGGAAQQVRADIGLARQYQRALDEIRGALGIAEPASLALLSALPGVISAGEGVTDPELLWQAIAPGLDAALTALVAARAGEGEALRADLVARLDTLEVLARDISGLTRDAPELHKRKLRERLDRSLKQGEPITMIDPQRLAQEVAVVADKLDVTEELTRIAAHIAECRRLCGSNDASGRRLDFLTQELNREINTVGSKSQSADVAARVVDAKVELERLREQIQNVE
jgi:uncharacterized protein (TIGR00255 family)